MDTFNIVLVILSIGTIIGPVLFGFVLFRMTSIFVTKTQFEDYKLLATREREFIYESLKRIEDKLGRMKS